MAQLCDGYEIQPEWRDRRVAYDNNEKDSRSRYELWEDKREDTEIRRLSLMNEIMTSTKTYISNASL